MKERRKRRTTLSGYLKKLPLCKSFDLGTECRKTTHTRYGRTFLIPDLQMPEIQHAGVKMPVMPRRFLVFRKD